MSPGGRRPSHASSMSRPCPLLPRLHLVPGAAGAPDRTGRQMSLPSVASSSSPYPEGARPPHDPTLLWNLSLDPHSCLPCSMEPPYQKFPILSHSHLGLCSEMLINSLSWANCLRVPPLLIRCPRVSEHEVLIQRHSVQFSAMCSPNPHNPVPKLDRTKQRDEDREGENL